MYIYIYIYVYYIYLYLHIYVYVYACIVLLCFFSDILLAFCSELRLEEIKGFFVFVGVAAADIYFSYGFDGAEFNIKTSAQRACAGQRAHLCAAAAQQRRQQQQPAACSSFKPFSLPYTAAAGV